VLRVHPLAEDDARDLIRSPIEDFPVRYEEEAVERILTATGRQPFLIQATCRYLVNLLNHEQRHHVGLTDVEQALASCLESCAFYFEELWRGKDADDAQRTVLTVLAEHSGGPVSEATLTRRVGKRELYPALQRLLRRDILEHVDGGYEFLVKLAADWVRSEHRGYGET